MKLASRQRLSDAGQLGMYLVDLDRLPRASGVYVFARQWGSGFEALYVGKATDLRQRLKTQLNNLRLMQHVHGARTGRRVILAGTLVTKRGQQIDRCLPIVERAFINYFLLKGDDLVNIQGTHLRQHEIESTRRPGKVIPQVMYVDRSRQRLAR
jgi:hypothetical protein